MIAAIALALAIAQQDTPPPDPKPGEPFSILANQPCPKDASGKDVVVCGHPNQTQRLPLPDERVPYAPQPSNPDLTGAGALAESESCVPGASMGGCYVGLVPPIMPVAKAVIGAVKSAFARKPDKTGRVPIPLGDPVPADVSDRLHD
jgi:hypothetical protein